MVIACYGPGGQAIIRLEIESKYFFVRDNLLLLTLLHKSCCDKQRLQVRNNYWLIFALL